MAGMALPKDYTGEGCSLARALEVVGERWTLLIVRDAFFGVRRFGDFAAHLAIPRAVLTHRLSALADAGVLAVVPGPHGHDEYALTGKGLDLWPVVRSMLAWGDDYYSEKGPRRAVPARPRRRGRGAGRHLRHVPRRGARRRPRGRPRTRLGAAPGQRRPRLGGAGRAAPPPDPGQELLTVTSRRPGR